MGEANSEKLTKEKIYGEIEEIRSQVQADSKLRMRAQIEIFDLLDEALSCLEKDGSESSLNRAAFKIATARCRKMQAKNQKMWLSVVICLWGILTLAFSLFAIVQWQLWPQTAKMAFKYILLGSAVWGLLGSSLDGLRELHTRYARQELDPNRIFWYLAHPVIGAGLGGILFLLVFAGLLAVGQTEILPQAQGTAGGGFNPSLPFVLAALAGFEQKNVIWYLRDTIGQILHISEREPHEAG